MAIEDEILKCVDELGRLLRAQKKTVSTAESCTGGGIAAAMTEMPGSSDWFMGAFVTYSNQWKMERLGVSESTLNQFGAVSQQTVTEMLAGLLKEGKTDYGIAVSGIAGPGGGTADKPVGTVYIGVAGKNWNEIQRCHFDGNRHSVRNSTILKALQMLMGHIGA